MKLKPPSIHKYSISLKHPMMLKNLIKIRNCQLYSCSHKGNCTHSLYPPVKNGLIHRRLLDSSSCVFCACCLSLYYFTMLTNCNTRYNHHLQLYTSEHKHLHINNNLFWFILKIKCLSFRIESNIFTLKASPTTSSRSLKYRNWSKLSFYHMNIYVRHCMYMFTNISIISSREDGL